MRNRREFLEDLSLAAAGASLAGCRATKVLTPTEAAARRLSQPRFMWAYLAHFGMKLWESRCHYADLKVDDSMWKSLTERAAEIGVNVFVIDLAEGMVFPSHPELAVRGSWEPERMHEEIARLKKMGMIAVPKLNFSSSHDQWLGKWRPYLSTPEYFQVCSEVIDDVAGITLVGASTLGPEFKASGKSGATVEGAAELGAIISKKAQEKGITTIVFDRGGNLYHGRIKALGDAAREAGLEF